MSERNLLGAAIADRIAFERVAPHITDGDLTDQGRIIMDHLTEFYDRDAGAQHCDSALLARDVARGLSNPKHKAAFTGLIEDITAEQHSPANVVHDFIAVKREAVGHRLASMLAAGRDPGDVRPLIGEYEDWCQASDIDEVGDEEAVMVGASVTDLVRTSYTDEALIKVWPPALNDKLDGGCLPGHHIVVFARPEMGKTMFLVNAMAGFLAQDRRVLYIGNEDPISDIVLRVVGRLTGMTKHEIMDDPDLADTEARRVGYENLILAGLAPGSPREIERLILEYKPQVLLIDQLRNLNVGEEHFVQKLEKAATAARNLGKKHDLLVISVTQAGDSASGKAVLDMGDIDSSNTGIPAQADVMVGIGATREDEAMGRRVLSLCKNKRSGKHDCIPVNVDPHTCNIGGS